MKILLDITVGIYSTKCWSVKRSKNEYFNSNLKQNMNTVEDGDLASDENTAGRC